MTIACIFYVTGRFRMKLATELVERILCMAC
jgi:hypothetical protein